MKAKRLLATVLMVVLLFSFSQTSLISIAAAPSQWAVSEMNEANMMGLLTPSAARNFQKKLTREEFCELVVGLVETTLGKTLPITGTNPFTDTNAIHVLKAVQYGITNGTSATKFSPGSTVQRQQICTMMIRAIQGMERDLGKTLLSSPTATLPFNDAAQIADYAVLPMRYAYSNEIMMGDRNYVYPKNDITSEECVATVIRSFIRMENTIVSGRTTAQNLDLTEARLNIGYAFGDCESGVTKNIVLPTKGAGGAVISWTSNNSSVISAGNILYDKNGNAIARTGNVNVGQSNQTVILTATITISGNTRTKSFTLRTSTATNDQLLLDNAYSELDIIYTNTGDHSGSVTGRLGLPDKVMDIPVTWSTSNNAVVTATGIVYVPSGNEIRNATLTATIRSGSLLRTKTFVLTVINPLNSTSALLHGVEMGMTQQQVTTALGAASSTIQASSSEQWQLYHAGNYTSFIAVAFINSRVAAVYSMASNVANQLKNNGGAVITVEQANVINGITAVSYSDATQQYAIMIYQTGSVIGSARTFDADGMERFLFGLVNAYRVRYNMSALEWSGVLGGSGSPARQHSEAMRSSGNISAGSGSTSLDSRAATAGFAVSGNNRTYTGGGVMAGHTDMVGFLHELVSTSTMRGVLMTNGATLFGAGFAGSTTGFYRTYMTFMLGSVRFITNVSASPVSGTPASVIISGTGAGSTVAVTLTPTFTSLISSSAYNETYTVESSNTGIMLVAADATVNRYNVTGVTQGNVNLVVTGRLSGKQYNIPVIVGFSSATGLKTSISSPAAYDLLISSGIKVNNSQTLSFSALVIGTGTGTNDGLNIIATATPSVTGQNPSVIWDIYSAGGTGIAVTSGRVTATTAGTAIVRARVATGASTYIEHRITVHVIAAEQVRFSANGTFNITSVNIGDIATASVTLPISGIVATPAYAWTSSNVTQATVAQANTAQAAITAVTAGSPVITYTATWSTAPSGNNNANRTGTIGRITRASTLNIRAAFATDITITPGISIDMRPGERVVVSAVPSPVNTVGRPEIKYNYSVGVVNVLGSGSQRTFEATDIGAMTIEVVLEQTGGETLKKNIAVNVKWPSLALAPDMPIDAKIGAQNPVFSAVITDNHDVTGYFVQWYCAPLASEPGAADINQDTGVLKPTATGLVEVYGKLMYKTTAGDTVDTTIETERHTISIII